MLFRNLVLGSLLATLPANAYSAPANANSAGKIMAIGNVGGIRVDGKPITLNTEIPATASISTTSVAAIKIGNDNVMNIAAGSQLNLVPEKDGKVGIQLQKGSVEGVRRIDPGLAGATTVATKAGDFEVPGGRYEIKVGDGENSPVQFKALDMTASFTPASDGSVNVKQVSLPATSPVTIANKGQVSSPAYRDTVIGALQNTMPPQDAIDVLAAQFKPAELQEGASSDTYAQLMKLRNEARPGDERHEGVIVTPDADPVMTVESRFGIKVTAAGDSTVIIGAPSREIASVDAGGFGKINFIPRTSSELPQVGAPSAPVKAITFEPPVAKPNTINRDPLQTPKNPTVTVKFKY